MQLSGFVDLVVTHYPWFYITTNIFVQFIVYISLNNDFNFYQWACKIRKKFKKKNVLPLQRLLHNIALSFNLYHIYKKKKKTYQGLMMWGFFFFLQRGLDFKCYPKTWQSMRATLPCCIVLLLETPGLIFIGTRITSKTLTAAGSRSVSVLVYQNIGSYILG